MATEAERSSRTMMLGDGRQLGYAEWGATDSDTVVFDLHGGPGCRLSVSGDVDTIATSDVRWVTLDGLTVRRLLGEGHMFPFERTEELLASVR